jgi:outer membrane protein
MIRYLTFIFAIGFAAPSVAGGVAVVDFQRAVTETREGKQAQAKLDGIYEVKRKEIERMRDDLQKAIQSYQGQKAILSPDHKASTEQKLMIQQERFQTTYTQYQSEMQQTYMEMLQGLDKKMRAMTQTIAKDKGYDLVVDKAVVVYAGGSTIDITSVLIQRYNAQ